MIKTLKITLRLFFIALFTLCLSLILNLTAAEDVCSAVTEKTLKEHIPLNDFKIIAKKQTGIFCEVVLRAGNTDIPLYVGDGFVISGDMYVKQKKVGEELLNEIKKKRFLEEKSKFDELTAFVYTPKKPTGRIIYMISEPTCPHCSKAAVKIKSVADKTGLTVKTLMLSVHNGIGKDKCIDIICNGFGLDDYIAKSSIESVPKICDEGKRKVKEFSDIAEKLDIDGVPVFFLDDGSMYFLSGLDGLEKKLKR
jgi:protein-disulfide isomerase